MSDEIDYSQISDNTAAEMEAERTNENAVEFLNRVGMNGHQWAVEFMSMWGHKLNEVDQELMVGWFCNSIMAGYDRAMNQQQKKIDELEKTLRETMRWHEEARNANKWLSEDFLKLKKELAKQESTPSVLSDDVVNEIAEYHTTEYLEGLIPETFDALSESDKMWLKNRMKDVVRHTLECLETPPVARPPVSEGEIQKAASECSSWHACGTGDCNHDKWTECCTSLFAEGVHWAIERKANLGITLIGESVSIKPAITQREPTCEAYEKLERENYNLASRCNSFNEQVNKLEAQLANSLV